MEHSIHYPVERSIEHSIAHSIEYSIEHFIQHSIPSHVEGVWEMLGPPHVEVELAVVSLDLADADALRIFGDQGIPYGP